MNAHLTVAVIRKRTGGLLLAAALLFQTLPAHVGQVRPDGLPGVAAEVTFTALNICSDSDGPGVVPVSEYLCPPSSPSPPPPVRSLVYQSADASSPRSVLRRRVFRPPRATGAD